MAKIISKVKKREREKETGRVWLQYLTDKGLISVIHKERLKNQVEKDQKPHRKESKMNNHIQSIHTHLQKR